MGHDEGGGLSLRVAPITICRRLRRGELEGKLADTPSGQAWLLRLPEGEASQPRSNGTAETLPDRPDLLSDSALFDGDPPHDRGQFDSLVALVDKLQQQNLELAGRVGYYQAENQQLRETLKALQAPSPEPEPASPSPDTEATPPDPPRRPWYQRLLFG